MEYLEAWGTLIHEKNLKSKISCQTPFKSSRPVLLGKERFNYYNCNYFKKVSYEKKGDQKFQNGA